MMALKSKKCVVNLFSLFLLFLTFHWGKFILEGAPEHMLNDFERIVTRDSFPKQFG